MQPVLTVLKGSDARRRYKPPARPYHLFYYTGFVNTFTENGRTFYTYPPLRGTSFHRKEGGSIHASPFPWKGLPSAARRGWLLFEAALGCSRIIAHLRQSSSLFFIPLEPYPARSARHLPHAGKALCRGYRFPHPTSAPSGHLLP